MRVIYRAKRKNNRAYQKYIRARAILNGTAGGIQNENGLRASDRMEGAKNLLRFPYGVFREDRTDLWQLPIRPTGVTVMLPEEVGTRKEAGAFRL